MSEKQYTEFVYIGKDDYDKKVKINRDDVSAYSKKKLKDLYPEKNFAILRETFEKKQRDKKKDIGRIELNEKRLYVSENGRHNKLFKKQGAFVAVEDGFIAILKTRLWPLLLLLALVVGSVAGGLYTFLAGDDTPTGGDTGGDITPVEPVVLTITGVVTKDGNPLENAALSLQKGNEEIATANTDGQGKYLINDVKNGNYNLVCTYGDSVLTKIASVWGESIVVNFIFPADDLHDVEDITDHHEKEDLPEITPTDDTSIVKALVKILGENTPPIAVGGLSEEALLHMIVGKEVDVTFLATLLAEGEIPAADKAAIEALSGELEMTWYDFSILKEIYKDKKLESSEYLTHTKTVLEIAVPYDSSRSVATYAFRYHGGKAEKLDALSEKPSENYQDGTYYVENSTVYIYSNCFSTYAIGAANTGQVVRGSDTIIYSGQATVNLRTNKIDLLYKHDADSSNAAKVEVYLVGSSGNLLIAASGEIPVGYQITGLTLKEDIQNMPSVGTYEGLMKIIYLGTDGAASTNVDIPLTVAVTK